MSRFSIFGAGAWGTALAVHLARAEQEVCLVPRRAEHAEAMRAAQENADYLPDVPLPESLVITHDQDAALERADAVFLGCPSVGLGDLCRQLKGSPAFRAGTGGHTVISLAKGLERNTLDVPSKVVQGVLPGQPLGVLSGPSFAAEIARGKPAALVLAMQDMSPGVEAIQAALSNTAMRIYLSEDVLGVELGGCLKNIYAIASGICASLELGSNATAALLTRALNEMVAVAVGLGADARTLYGLSGFGDLMATCSDDQSRNRSFGRRIGLGESADAVIASQKTVVEGYWACDCFHRLCEQKGLAAPIMNQIHAVLYEGKPASAALNDLMTRSLKTE